MNILRILFGSRASEPPLQPIQSSYASHMAGIMRQIAETDSPIVLQEYAGDRSG
jgi:hypothetical protein